MCAYNDTDTTIRVEFDCGVFCYNDWYMEAGSHDCRPNKSGHLLAGYVINITPSLSYHHVNLPVEAHGWVVIRPATEGGFSFCAYSQDGEITGCQGYIPES